MALTPAQRNELIDDLRGTCQTIDSALDKMLVPMTEDDLTPGDHAAIDDQIFECESCGWWCEQGEQAEGHDDTCSDCATENKEPDDGNE